MKPVNREVCALYFRFITCFPAVAWQKNFLSEFTLREGKLHFTSILNPDFLSPELFLGSCDITLIITAFMTFYWRWIIHKNPTLCRLTSTLRKRFIYVSSWSFYWALKLNSKAHKVVCRQNTLLLPVNSEQIRWLLMRSKIHFLCNRTHCEVSYQNSLDSFGLHSRIGM